MCVAYCSTFAQQNSAFLEKLCLAALPTRDKTYPWFLPMLDC